MIFTPFSFIGSQFDPNALLFITTAGITNPVEQVAINNLVIGLKRDSLWGKMIAIYPFVGGTSTTTKYNLANPIYYEITWNGGVTYASTGVKGNGSNAYGDTGIEISATNTSTGITTSLSYSVYSRTDSTGEDIDMGVDRFAQIQLLCKRGNGNCIMDNYNSTNGRINASVTNSQGFFLSTRTSQTLMRGYRNNSQIGSDVTGSATTSNITICAKNIYVLAQNYSTSGAQSFSNRELAFMHFGLGLDTTESTNLYNLVDAFQKTLKRNV